LPAAPSYGYHGSMMQARTYKYMKLQKIWACLSSAQVELIHLIFE
jgi:hypothetical protein